MTATQATDPPPPREPARRRSPGDPLDLTGLSFGKWTVIGRDLERSRPIHWTCRCECGNEKSVYGHSLMRGMSLSCGRCKNVAANRATYAIWSGMRCRCINPSHRAFALYGGRGITVDPRWDDFATFLADMGPKPEGRSLDRIDNDGPYSPENCRWATGIEQHNNTRTNRRITLDGRTQTMAQWARERGINYRTVKSRLNIRGLSYEEALTP